MNYREYINSPAWREKREQYWASGLPTSCYCCGRARHRGMHLHHRTYKNLGNERLMDLVPMCVDCHDFVHRVHRSHPAWKRKGLWATTKYARKIKQGAVTKGPYYDAAVGS